VCICRAGTDIVYKAAKDRVSHYLQSLKQHFAGKYFFNYTKGIFVFDI
jgi:hypothetical protein